VSGVIRAILALVGLAVSARLALQFARYFRAAVLPAGRPSAPASSSRLDGGGTLGRLTIEPGMRVLQLGPAAASEVAELGRRVGKYGRVYVLERSPERAEALADGLRVAKLPNVEVLSGDPARMELPDSTFDLALCVDALADLPRRQRALWELQRVLRPRGRLTVRERFRPPLLLTRGRLTEEAAAVGLECREARGLPVAYSATFEKSA
jgi:SAM-dependent methyltransferase